MQRNRKIKCKNNDPETKLTYIKQVNELLYDRQPLNVANVLCEGGDWYMVPTEKEGRKHCFINKNGDTVQKCFAGPSFIPNNLNKASGIYKKYKKLPNSKYYSKSSKMRKIGGPIMEGEKELKLTRYHNLLDRLAIRKANNPISSAIAERSIESDTLVSLKGENLYNLLKTKIYTKVKVKEFIEKRVYLPIEKFYIHNIKETFEETAKMLLDPTNRTLMSFNTYKIKYNLVSIV